MTTTSFPSRRQRGLSLIFSLLALVALTLGAVALVRSVDLGLLAIGNLTAKQTGVAAAAQGAEQAMTWIEARRAESAVALDNNRPADGYFAVAFAGLDPTGRAAGSDQVLSRVDWESDGCKVDGEEVDFANCLSPKKLGTIGGEEVHFVITRMCAFQGGEEAKVGGAVNTCLRPPYDGVAKAGGNRDAEGSFGGETTTVNTSAYFRIIVRTKNAKGTVAFTETLVHY